MTPGNAESLVGDVTTDGTEPGAIASATRRLAANLAVMPNGCINRTTVQRILRRHGR